MNPIVNRLLMAPQGMVKNGLAALYKFDEGQGQVLTDYSGNGNHGQLGSATGVDTNDPTWIPPGLSFTTDDYVKLPYMINAEQDFTVYVVANIGESIPTVYEVYMSLGSSMSDIQRMTVSRSPGDGHLFVSIVNDANASSGEIQITAQNVTPGIRLLKVMRTSNMLMLKDVRSGATSTLLPPPANPITLNQATLGAKRGTTAALYLNQPEYFASFYNRATTDAEDQLVYRYMKRELAKVGVAI